MRGIMQGQVLHDESTLSECQQQCEKKARRPLFTLGWDLVLAEEGPLPTKHARDDTTDVQKRESSSSNNNNNNSEYAFVGGGLSPPSLPEPQDTRHVPRPSVADVWEMAAPQSVAPDAPPPLWISPFFDGDVRDESFRDGQTIVLQEVLPAIGSKCRSRTRTSAAAVWGQAAREEGAVLRGVMIEDDGVMRGSGQASTRVASVTRSVAAAALVKEEEEEERKPQLPERARGVFSWEDIMRDAGGATRGDGETEGEDEGRQQEREPSGLRHSAHHSSALRGIDLPCQKESPHGRHSPGASPPVLLSAQPQELAAAAEKVRVMQETADELTHRLLTAERELSEERGECAALRKNIICIFEAAERLLQEKIRVLRDLRSENERHRQMLGC